MSLACVTGLGTRRIVRPLHSAVQVVTKFRQSFSSSLVCVGHPPTDRRSPHVSPSRTSARSKGLNQCKTQNADIEDSLNRATRTQCQCHYGIGHPREEAADLMNEPTSPPQIENHPLSHLSHVRAETPHKCLQRVITMRGLCSVHTVRDMETHKRASRRAVLQFPNHRLLRKLDLGFPLLDRAADVAPF